MVSVVKRKKGVEYYYYLRHNIRKGNRQKEIYLGKEIPKNIDEIKQNFLLNFYKEEWIPKLEKIQKESKKERKKIPKSILKKEIENFSIKFTYNTQKIEGSTLTLRETAELLKKGRTPANKPLGDAKEAEAHQKLFFEILKGKMELTLETICVWHKRLFSDTKPDIAGKIRNYDVGIGGSRFTPPKYQAVPILLRDFFRWYKENVKKLNPVILSALVHLRIVTIHPFGDGNGRISRLLMNFVLSKYGYPLLDIDYGNRNSYYNALERSQVKNEEIAFLQWFMRRYLKTHKKYLS